MHALARSSIVVSTLTLAWLGGPHLAHADYRLERIASGLSQPTYVTQAPGDTNFLYILERANTSNGSKLGRILKYDVNTRTHTTVFDFGTLNITGDAALATMAFSPDFQTDNKFYLAWNTGTSGQLGISRVQEYTIGGGGSATLTRTLLEYNSNTTANNHTVDWIGFDPTATGDARNYLYITTGDGGPQANQVGYVNRAQDLNQIYGKLLRIDVSGGDDYPGSATKNFAIPDDNPIPSGGGAGLGEVYASGLRNPWRASFDRANGDLWIGDVGFNSREEIDFLKAGSVGAGTPPDFGWARREGMIQTPVTGIGGTQGASINPIIDRTHATDQSITGGYVYRGPITELQGKYIFGDYVTGNVYTFEGFDRDTDPSTFNGANGTVTNVTALFDTLTVDPSNPGYVPGPSSFGINLLSSFGEDNAGNVYLIDFGIGANAGEIFRLTPVLDGDFDDDNDVDADDINILWAIVRSTGSDPNANDSADLDGNSVVDSADVDYMLADLLSAGPNRAYGDADLDGGVGGLDFTAWRLREGTGWAHGDFDGDGGIGGLDFTLWRTRPTVYDSGGGGEGIAAVPEPATLVLLGLAIPAFLGLARRRVR